MKKAQFFTQFAALLSSGLPVIQSFEQAGRATLPPRFVQQTSRQLRQGETLAALAHNSPFSAWEIELLRLGERSGCLPAVCQRLAQPLAVGWPQGRLYGAGLLRHLPGLRGLVVARSQLHLAELALPLSCGLPLSQSLALVQPRIPDPGLAAAVGRAAQLARQGQPLGQSLQGQVPPLTLQLIRTGEASGTLDTLLNQIGEYYAAELVRQQRQLALGLRLGALLVAGASLLGLAVRLLAELALEP
jgi:type II secretory pathway component PulF